MNDKDADRYAKGQLSAQERLELLFDPATAVLEAPADEGALWIGRGKLGGRAVVATARDAERAGGSLSLAEFDRLTELTREAARLGTPMVDFLGSAGLRANGEGLGLASLAAADAWLAAKLSAAGKALRVSVITGELLGAEAMIAAASDLVSFSRAGGFWSLSGAELPLALFGQDLPAARFGGAELHAELTGLVALTAENDLRAVLDLRAALLLLAPSPRHITAPQESDAFTTLLPLDPLESWSPEELMARVSDGCEVVELWAGEGDGLAVALARLGGRPVGLMASRVSQGAGLLDTRASRKAARFVELLARLGLPLVQLVDCAGVLPGQAEEEAASLAHLTALRSAIAAHGAPKVALVLRRAFGPAALALGLFAPEIRVLRWPDAAIGLTQSDLARAPHAHGREIAPNRTRLALIDALAAAR